MVIFKKEAIVSETVVSEMAVSINYAKVRNISRNYSMVSDGFVEIYISDVQGFPIGVRTGKDGKDGLGTGWVVCQ